MRRRCAAVASWQVEILVRAVQQAVGILPPQAIGELLKKISTALPLLEQKGPSTFWHPGNVGGPFRLSPKKREMIDVMDSEASASLAEARWATRLTFETQAGFDLWLAHSALTPRFQLPRQQKRKLGPKAH